MGVAAWRLGAGRARKEDPVQAGAGVELHAKPGDRVRAGQPLLTLHTDTPERFERARQAHSIGRADRTPGHRPDRLTGERARAANLPGAGSPQLALVAMRGRPAGERRSQAEVRVRASAAGR